jgi:hypothetical protein
MADEVVIDLEKLRGEISGLSDEALKEQLLNLRVREKYTQKKNYGSASAKMYAARQREKMKLLKALAREKGIYDSIDAEAEIKAEEKLAEDRAAAVAGED